MAIKNDIQEVREITYSGIKALSEAAANLATGIKEILTTKLEEAARQERIAELFKTTGIMLNGDVPPSKEIGQKFGNFLDNQVKSYLVKNPGAKATATIEEKPNIAPSA